MLLRSLMNTACEDRLWWSNWLYLSYEIDTPWCFFILELHWQCSEKKTFQAAQYLRRESRAAGAWEQAPEWVGFHSWEWSTQLSWLHRSGKPFCGGKKNPVMQGIVGILQGKSRTFLQRDIHLYLGRSFDWGTSMLTHFPLERRLGVPA